jgi:two-component system, NtrC family, sensor histidine kinase HydH
MAMENRLIRRFALLSFVVIGVTTAALSYVIASSLERDMLAREWTVTSSYIRLEARQWLSAADFADGPDARRHFAAFSAELMRIPETIRVKLYDRSARVVWSDEPRLIGQRFADNPELAEALEGRTVADLRTGKRKSENVFESPPRFVELYVPLAFPPGDGAVGVAEIYKAPEEVFSNIRRAWRIVAGTSVAGAVLLWASLFGIVRGAALRIDRQHRALQERSRELSAANDELRGVQAQLVASERMAAVGEVVAAVAHGIRNPLAAVRASAQVALLDCRQCAGPQGATASIDAAIGEVDRLANRVSELLRFVKPVERPSERVDLNAVVAESLRMLKERLGAGRVRVVERLAADLSPIDADAMLIEEAVVGLVENAIDAMGDEGTLTLVTAVDGGHVTLDVGDDGPGIPAHQLERIFDLFYTTKTQGTGLGLSLARKFIEAYGGTLTVTSRPERGTVFRVSLPAAGA